MIRSAYMAPSVSIWVGIPSNVIKRLAERAPSFANLWNEVKDGGRWASKERDFHSWGAVIGKGFFWVPNETTRTKHLHSGTQYT